MNLLLLFSDAARKAFMEAHIEGNFEGFIIKKVEGKNIAYFIYMDPTGRLAKTPWEQAPGYWEGIYRTTTRQA